MNNFKDDFTEEIYRGMFQKLIVNFHTSNKILEICLFFVENRIRQKPTFENMNLLLYIISKSDNNDDNKKLIIEFIKRNYNIFTTKFNYNISTVISDILTQILLYQVLLRHSPPFHIHGFHISSPWAMTCNNRLKYLLVVLT